MDTQVPNEDGAVRKSSVPGEGYNNDQEQAGEGSKTPGRTPSGKAQGEQNESSREADREGE